MSARSASASVGAGIVIAILIVILLGVCGGVGLIWRELLS
jgi:hypothetical protein